MRKLFFILLTLLTLGAYAKTYTQQGIIKTKGRMLSDGRIEPGTNLSSAFVTIKDGNTWESNSNGMISFPVDKDAPFYIQKVYKSGYILTDYDLLSRSLKYSYSTPIYITLEKQGDKIADELAAAQKIRRTLNNRLLAQKREADSLLTANKIAEEEYRSLLQKLIADQTAAEMLVKSMSEEYAKIDFDQVDDFYREVSSLILNGELHKADSLLSTKGDINKDITDLNIHRKANENIRKRLEKREESAYNKMMDIADRCHKKAQIHQLRFEHDSVVYYLSLRAKLDTLNLQWQRAVASHIADYQSDYDRAISLYNKALEISKTHKGENHSSTGEIYNDIGIVYRRAGNSKKALEYLLLAKDVCSSNPNFGDIGVVYGNILNVYMTLSDSENVKKYTQLCLENIPQEPIYNRIACRIRVADGLEWIGDNESLLKAKQIYTEELENCYKEFGENHILTVGCLQSLGFIYGQAESIQQSSKAVEFLTKALNINKQIYGEKHTEVATSLLHMSILYIYSNYAQGLHCCKEALAIMDDIGLLYHPITAQILGCSAFFYNELNDLESAKKSALKALEIHKMLHGEAHDDVQATYLELSKIALKMGDKASAVSYAEKSMETNIAIYGENDHNTANSYREVGDIYRRVGNDKEALRCYSNAARIVEQGLKSDVSYLIYEKIGDVYKNRKRYKEAIDNYIKADNLTIAYGGINAIERGSVQFRLCSTYYDDGNLTKALEHAILARDIWQKHLPEDHDSVVTAKEAVQNLQEALKR